MVFFPLSPCLPLSQRLLRHLLMGGCPGPQGVPSGPADFHGSRVLGQGGPASGSFFGTHRAPNTPRAADTSPGVFALQSKGVWLQPPPRGAGAEGCPISLGCPAGLRLNPPSPAICRALAPGALLSPARPGGLAVDPGAAKRPGQAMCSAQVAWGSPASPQAAPRGLWPVPAAAQGTADPRLCPHFPLSSPSLVLQL